MKKPLPASASGLPEVPSEVHLDSWKEIAAYVRRDVSTVQRWEKREGMPVHRHIHDKSSSVHGVTSELDAWLQSRKARLETEQKERGDEDNGKQSAAPIDTESGHWESYIRRRPWLVLTTLTLTILIAVTYLLTRSGSAHATGPKITSLAVLPLRNASRDPAQQYFVDGLTDELTTDLAKLGNLRVISRSSAMFYAATDKPLPQIAKDLKVDAVLTGTVERSGKRVRVRTALVRPAGNEVLWAESYDRDLDDVLSWEDEVSRTIAREVGVTLTPEAQHRVEHKPTSNSEAREAYFRGRYFLDKNADDKEGGIKCVQYFQEAIAKDPGYAAAYAELSRCYQHFDLGPDGEADSTAALMKAVELDDHLAEAHAQLGNYYLGAMWDYSTAEREYKRAIELDSNLSVAHSDYGFLLVDLGRTEQGLEEIHRARDLDPLSLDVAEDAGIRLLSSRRYDEALAQFRGILEINPTYTRARWMLARTYELKGLYKEAISECLKIPALPNVDAATSARFKRRCSLYEKIYTTSGGKRFNRHWVQSARQEIKDAIHHNDDVYFIATLYAETGENEKALDLLERSYAQHDSELLQLKVDPRLDNLRPDTRFQALLRRMHFPA